MNDRENLRDKKIMMTYLVEEMTKLLHFKFNK